MATAPGPAVARSATGQLLAVGPAGPQGPQGKPGPQGTVGPVGGAFPGWTRYNFTGSGGAQASGAVLPTPPQPVPIGVLADTVAGQTIVGAPANPADGQPVTVKDPNGNWVNSPAKWAPGAGWDTELPAAPGTYGGVGVTITLWPQAGASVAFVADAVQKVWLIA